MRSFALKPIECNIWVDDYFVLFIFNRGLELNPAVKSFEITFFLPEMTSIAAFEASVKLLLIDSQVHGFTESKISMLCN